MSGIGSFLALFGSLIGFGVENHKSNKNLRNMQALSKQWEYEIGNGVRGDLEYIKACEIYDKARRMVIDKEYFISLKEDKLRKMPPEKFVEYITDEQLQVIQDKIKKIEEDPFASVYLSLEQESLRDEEQDALDNMPESLEETERYSNMELAVENLDAAVDSFEELIGSLNESAL